MSPGGPVAATTTRHSRPTIVSFPPGRSMGLPSPLPIPSSRRERPIARPPSNLPLPLRVGACCDGDRELSQPPPPPPPELLRRRLPRLLRCSTGGRGNSRRIAPPYGRCRAPATPNHSPRRPLAEAMKTRRRRGADPTRRASPPAASAPCARNQRPLRPSGQALVRNHRPSARARSASEARARVVSSGSGALGGDRLAPLGSRELRRCSDPQPQRTLRDHEQPNARRAADASEVRAAGNTGEDRKKSTRSMVRKRGRRGPDQKEHPGTMPMAPARPPAGADDDRLGYRRLPGAKGRSWHRYARGLSVVGWLIGLQAR